MESIHGSIVGPTDRLRAQEAEARAQLVLSDAELQRILSAPTQNETPTPRQVFVNRNLHLGKVELIGFDMDYTLAIYHLRRLEQLSYDLTVERLVEKYGYPAEIRTIPYDHAFVLRGVFVDKPRGNLLKIDRFGYVGRAYHGRRLLPDAEIQRLYRNERIRMKSTDYAWIDTLFALPEACLLAGIIELYETKLNRPMDNYTKLYDDIREAIDSVHRDNSLKKLIRADIGRYIFKDPELGPALHKLRSGGKKLFVLTNSLWDYTNAVMSFLLDGVLPEYPSWKNYFDYIITGGAKPAFFSEQRPFLVIDPATEENKVLGEATELERGKIYQGGNLADFERLTGHQGESVLYVGDHIYGDILKSKKTSMWRTCMIVQEIEDELSYLEARR
ncbi:MAG: HAD-IG family 5'-nucleotidase, partial [Myxococcota bacterium]